MKQFGKILKFELKGYLKNKIFVGITIFLVALIAVVMFLPNITAIIGSNTDTPQEEKPVMAIYSEDQELAILAKEYFAPAFENYTVSVASGALEQVKEQIISGEIECVFALNSASSFTYFVNNLSMYDTNASVASTVLQEVYRINAMIHGGLSAEEASQIMSVQIESQTTTLGKNQINNFLYTYIMIMALYMVIMLYGQMVATNVATEKSSRAMEVLITSAKPTNMMFGKVLASCIAGFSQLVIIFGSAILLYNVNKPKLNNPLISSIFNIPLDLFGYMLIFFVLGFLIYAFLYGAIGSTASKLEDITTSVMPITFLFVIAFFIVITAISGGNVDSPLMIACSYIPFTSPMAMFTRICMSTVAWYEVLASVFILIASVVLIGFLAAKIYRVGVLLYGTPPKIKTLLKTVFSKNNSISK